MELKFNEATTVRPNHLERCLCYDKFLKGYRCYVYDDISKYWCTQATTEHDPDGENHIVDYADYQVTEWASLQQEQPDKESLNESQQEFVDIVTERMLKEGPIPTLKGKQKAEFEKEFNRFKQITGMINFPAHMEVYKRIILWFMAWSADNFPNLNKVTDPDELDFQQEQPEVDLEKELDKFYGMYRKDGKTYDITDDEEVSDWKEDGNSWFKIEFARHFYELGQLEMRHRITNPEYNAKVVEQLKSEYPARKDD